MWYVAEGMALLSGDLEGDHTHQGSAAGRAAHPQSGEFSCLEHDKLAKSMIVLQHKLLVEILITHARAHTHTHR